MSKIIDTDEWFAETRRLGLANLGRLSQTHNKKIHRRNRHYFMVDKPMSALNDSWSDTVRATRRAWAVIGFAVGLTVGLSMGLGF